MHDGMDVNYERETTPESEVMEKPSRELFDKRILHIRGQEVRCLAGHCNRVRRDPGCQEHLHEGDKIKVWFERNRFSALSDYKWTVKHYFCEFCHPWDTISGGVRASHSPMVLVTGKLACKQVDSQGWTFDEATVLTEVTVLDLVRS